MNNDNYYTYRDPFLCNIDSLVIKVHRRDAMTARELADSVIYRQYTDCYADGVINRLKSMPRDFFNEQGYEDLIKDLSDSSLQRFANDMASLLPKTIIVGLNIEPDSISYVLSCSLNRMIVMTRYVDL